MKKLLSLALALVICMSMCVCAFADMGGPEVRFYTRKVTNPNGAVLYQSEYDESTGKYNITEKTVVPYGEELEIRGEYSTPYDLKGNKSFEGKKVGSVGYEDKSGEYYWGYVMLTDLEPLKDTVAPEENGKLKIPQTYYVMAEKGVNLFKGPSNMFDVAVTVPKGTKLVLNYVDVQHVQEEDYDYDAEYEYYYTEYNGVKGWLYASIYDETFSLAKSIKDTNRYTGRIQVAKSGLKLLDIYSEAEDGYKTVSEEIPVGTMLNFTYYVESTLSSFAYTTYNGVNGFVELDNWSYDDNNEMKNKVIVYTNDYLMTLDDCPAYSEAGNLGSKTRTYVPEYTKVQLLACFFDGRIVNDEYYEYDWYLIKDEGNEEWICNIREAGNESAQAQRFFCFDRFSSSIMVVKTGSTAIYSAPDKDSEIKGALLKGDHIRSYASLVDYDTSTYEEFGFHYFEKDDTCGWIDVADIEYADDGVDVPLIAQPVTEEADTGADDGSAVQEPAPEIVETEPVSTDGNGMENVVESGNKTIIICIVAAVVLALTAAVTTLLIKKKKSN